MSNKKLHIIQKQLIDITLPNATAALEWEASKRRDFTALINTQLETCFDDYDKNGDHLVIEKLDIDLGTFTMNNLKEEVSQRLYSKLYSTLQEHSKTTIFAGLDVGQSYTDTSTTDRSYTGQGGKLAVLFYFLNRGRLPWWGSELTGWDENWLTSLTENEVSRFKNYIARSDEKPIRRLAIQFKDSFIELLLQRLGITDETAKAWQWLEVLLKNLEGTRGIAAGSAFQANQKFPHASLIRTEYWTEWILYTVSSGETPALYKLFSNRPEALEIIYSAVKKIYEKSPDKIPFLWKEEINGVINQSQKKRTEEEATTIQGVEQSEKKALFSEELIPVTKDQKTPQTDAGTAEIKDILSKPADKKSKKESEEEAIFVTNAGLIILHPFLPELFRHCGWLEKNKFVDEYAQTMAVYALHYLATGETAIPEHQLIFAKFLVGMEWETLLEPVELLNDREQSACNELLREVLKHWKPLSNTSLAGLQEAYLQRNGKLEHIYSGWHLSMEQKTLDILLSRLPWGISMIKLPWMTQPFTVAWQ